MKLSNKLIDEVITETAGEDVIKLVHKLKNKKNFSEFKLAEAIEQEINQTRNQLYRLLRFNLVSFNRKKDKKKGWYIYYWTFNLKRIKYLYKQVRVQKIERLKDRLERENSETFFKCTDGCMRLNFDQASEFEYKCPECGDLIEQEDNEKKKKEIEKEIKKLEKEVKALKF